MSKSANTALAAEMLEQVEQSTKSDIVKGKKKDKRKKFETQIGGRRGVETLFRNAYRAHLDLISLAATKANIMISINGLILSFLFISEAFVMSAEPLLEIPTALFLVTCFFSMSFAILSALPERCKIRGDLEDFRTDKANLLVFSQYALLPRDEYLFAMRELLQDSGRIYESMIGQLYLLGQQANKKFKFLQISYTVFLAGLGLSILMSFAVMGIFYWQGIEAAFSKLNAQMGSYPKHSSGGEHFPRFDDFRDLESIHEPSGVVQLPDGRLLIVQDEARSPFNLLSLDAEGNLHPQILQHEPLLMGGSGLRGLGKLDDLEAMAIDKHGYVHAITSHARTEKTGRLSPDRQKFVRFRVEGERVTDSAVAAELKSAIAASDPVLAEAARTKGRGETEGLNIEGLTFNREGDQLWLGFRSPLKNGQAIILVIENPQEIFEREAPQLAKQKILLDLDGAGIRGLAYAPRLDGYLILAAREDKKEGSFKLWLWSGKQSDVARRVRIEGLKDLRRAEGITPVRLGDAEGILIFSDEGATGRGEPARYILLQYKQLSVRLDR